MLSKRIEVKTSKHTLKYTQVQVGSFTAICELSMQKKLSFPMLESMPKKAISSEDILRLDRYRQRPSIIGTSTEAQTCTLALWRIRDCRRSNRPNQVSGEVGVCITEHNTPSSEKRCFNPVRITLKSFQPNQSRTCSLKDTRNDGITRCG